LGATVVFLELGRAREIVSHRVDGHRLKPRDGSLALLEGGHLFDDRPHKLAAPRIERHGGGDERRLGLAGDLVQFPGSKLDYWVRGRTIVPAVAVSGAPFALWLHFFELLLDLAGVLVFAPCEVLVHVSGPCSKGFHPRT